ncbi:MAG: hypothetical protein HY901_16915 [Deltaproteobacteria bacterium]|nr:hypothetical protein [Deltaproteobacteria bacterium]
MSSAGEISGRRAREDRAAEAHLLVFNRDPAVSPEQRIFRREESFGGRAITVWGM